MAEDTPQDEPQSEGGDIKKRALVRLGIAGLVTAAALAGLWWLDQSGKQQAEPAPEPPTRIITAPPPSEPPPPPEAAEPEPSAAEPAPEKVEEAPPPPTVEPTKPAPAKPVVKEPAKPAPARPTPAPAPAPAHQAAPAPSRPAPAPVPAPAAQPVPPPKAFVVQLGVFSNPDNAKELVERLRKQGIAAYTETRVHIGPFKNREEAERAQAEMRRLGYTPVVNPSNGATR